MKRTCLFLLFSIFAFAFQILAENGYEGGPARLLAMGGPEITVADESTELDLIGEGFTPGIFMRPEKSFISLYPELDVYTYNTDGGYGSKRNEFLIGGGTGSSFISNDGIQYFLSPDSAIIVKPEISGFGGNQSYMGDKDDNFQILTGGEINYAQKFSTNFAASLTAGYLWQGYYDARSDNLKYNSWIDKFEYEISGAFLPDNADGWSFAISAGNKTNMFVTVNENFDINLNAAQTISSGEFQFFNLHNYSMTGDTITTQEDYSDDYVSGIKIDFGAASAKSNSTQFDIRGGVLIGMNVVEKNTEVDTIKSTGVFTTTKSPDLKLLYNATGFEGDAGFRADLGAITAGIKMADSFISGNVAGGKMWMNMSSISAGEAFGNKKFLVPVELFYQAGNSYSKDATFENYSTDYDIGLRIGNEIELGEIIYLRYGIDFTAVSSYNKQKQDGNLIYESGATGSQDNPWQMQLGYNAGIGFTGKSCELNIGARIEPQWESPKENQYSVYNVINAKIFSDLKIYI